MKLATEDREVLTGTRIGMLAFRAGGHPLVNPAAFSVLRGSVWMTTSRYAAKLGLVAKDPRATFLVTSKGRSVSLSGILETYDPLTVQGQLRAFTQWPSVYPGLVHYAMRNVPYIAGYALDLLRVPTEWWPHNRTLLRLRVHSSRSFEVTGVRGPAEPSLLESPPTIVARALRRVPLAYLSWLESKGPVLAPALWFQDSNRIVVGVVDHHRVNLPEQPDDAALVVESHHPYRPSRMTGVCLRGRLTTLSHVPSALVKRYASAGEVNVAYSFRPERATWWRGFEVESSRVRAAARRTG